MSKLLLYLQALRENDATAAARWAAEMTPRDLPSLFALLRTERHFRVHERVPELVARLGGDLGELLVGATTDDELLVAGAALARVGDPRGLEPLRAVAAPGNVPWRRFEALQGLGRLGDFGTLARTILEPDVNLRLQCSAALARCGPAAVPALVGLLAGADEDVVRSALHCLGHLERCPPEAERFLRHPEPYTRSAALFALERADPERALAVALELAADPEAVVRRRVAGILGAALADDPDATVRREAVKKSPVDVLCRIVGSDPDPDVRLEAVGALGRSGDPAGLEALEHFERVLRVLFRKRKQRKRAQRALELARGRIRLAQRGGADAPRPYRNPLANARPAASDSNR